MPKKIADLEKSKAADIAGSVYFPEEQEFYSAFKRHVANSRSLYSVEKGGEANGSLYSLLMGIECLFKDIFCLLRYASGLDVKSIEFMTRTEQDKMKFESLLGARRFGHELTTKAVFLKKEIADLSISTDFGSLISVLPKDKGWVEQRYKIEVMPNPEAKCQYIFGLLVALARKELAPLIAKGDV